MTEYETPHAELPTLAQLGALAAALALAQTDLGTALKDKANPFHKSKYADLSSVWAAWQEVGPKNGLAVVQQVKDAGDRQGILLETTLIHKDGGYVASISFWPAVKNDPQAYGSALTYARRYTLSALVGVVADDDDGNAASGRQTAQQEADEDVQRFEEAVKKYSKDAAKLKKIREEAVKTKGLEHIVKKVDALLAGLQKEEAKNG